MMINGVHRVYFMWYLMVGLLLVNGLFFLGLLGRFVELRQAVGFCDSSPYVVIAKKRFGSAIIWAVFITTVSITLLLN